ncbi:MAG: hydrogenase, partial [Bacillota bacterium]|nr:hydrogenase [Bacillota bacterium]
DMDGLFIRLPKVAVFMIVGICGMFIAPFGMLISKWAAMVSIVDSGNPLLVMMLVFGSAATLFFWAKWLGKLCAVVAGRDDSESLGIPGSEKFVLSILAFLTVAICLFFPVLSSSVIVPYLEASFAAADLSILADSNLIIMTILVAIIVLMVVFFFGKTKKKIVPIYLSGENTGDDLTFRNSLKQPQEAALRNWYMESYFGERKMNLIGVISTVVVIGATFILIGGYALYVLLLTFGGVL